MDGMGGKLLLWVLGVLLLCGCGSQPARQGLTVAELSARDSVISVDGLGWNLGNCLDAHSDGVSSETGFGNPPVTKALFDSVAAAGVKCVRIPVTWLGHVGPAPDYAIDRAWLERVAEVVGYARDNHFERVIINIHHDGADGAHWLKVKEASTDPALDEAIRAQIAAMWRQIVTRFRGEGTWLVFECLNEIHDGGWGWGSNRSDDGAQYATLNGWMKTAVEAIRQAEDPDIRHWIGVAGYVTNPDLTIEHLALPDDPARRLMVSVHSYDPFDFALQAKATEWGHTADTTKTAPYSSERDCDARWKKLHDAYVAKGIPCYVGEICCTRRDNPRDEAFRQYWSRYQVKAALDNGLQVYIWDNGYGGTGEEQSGLFDRQTGAFLNSDARTIVNQMVGMFDPTVTLQSVYDSAPTF